MSSRASLSGKSPAFLLDNQTGSSLQQAEQKKYTELMNELAVAEAEKQQYMFAVQEIAKQRLGEGKIFTAQTNVLEVLTKKKRKLILIRKNHLTTDYIDCIVKLNLYNNFCKQIVIR